MKIIKSLLIMMLVVTAVGGGIYFVMLHTRPGQLPPQLASLEVLQPLVQDGLLKASQNLPDMTQIGSVLGTSTGVRKDGPSLPQQAFETARYTYCQQVIQDYQQRYSTASTSGKVSEPPRTDALKPAATTSAIKR